MRYLGYVVWGLAVVLNLGGAWVGIYLRGAKR